MNERKGIAIVEFKAESEGAFRAVFSTLNVVDKDGDVTRPDAFTKGEEVRIAQWGHNWGALPVGKGIIDHDDEKAWVDGSFFMDTAVGLDTYKVVKSLAALQEWSYGFEVTKSSPGEHDGQKVRFLEGVKVFEVSPVMLGAGIGTHTEAIKSLTAEQEFAEAEAAIAKVLKRMKVFRDLRAKEGRTLSAANRTRISELSEAMGAMREELEKLLAETETDPKDEPKAASGIAEFARFQLLTARRNGVKL